MKVMTLNCWGGRKYGSLIDLLPKLDADICCLQEVFDSSHEGFYSDSISEEKVEEDPVRADLFEVVGSLFPGYRGMMLPACRWHLRTLLSKETIPADFGIAMFVRKGISVHEVKTAFIHREFATIPQMDLPKPRVVQAIRCTNPQTGRPTVVAHMHGLWVPNGKGHNRDRARQFLKLRDLLCSIVQEGDRVIVCGDFNVLPDDPTITMLEAEFDLRELVTQRLRQGEQVSTRTSLYFNNPRKKAASGYADYVFVSDAGMVNRFDIVAEPEVSDHRPLVVDFE